MLPDSMIDGFLNAGLLPGVRTVTIFNPNAPTVGIPLQARREDATEDIKAAAGIEFGAETVVFFFPVGQPGFVRARNQWAITDTGGDGTTWYVKSDMQGIQSRGLGVICTRTHQ